MAAGEEEGVEQVRLAEEGFQLGRVLVQRLLVVEEGDGAGVALERLDRRRVYGGRATGGGGGGDLGVGGLEGIKGVCQLGLEVEWKSSG